MSGADAVKEDRLWQRHADMAKLGGTPQGRRQPPGAVGRGRGGPEPARRMGARAAVRGICRQRSAISLSSEAGRDAGAAPVLSGSHMDSQPTGGRFDGMYGVLAAFEALEALEDAGIETKRPVMAVAWTNEEGSRFQPGAMGSAVFAGVYKLDEMLGQKDWKGVVLKDALAETLTAAPAPIRDGAPGFPVDSYIEAHIEQGPRLENGRQDDRRRHRDPGQPALHRHDRRRGGACRHHAARRAQGRLRGGDPDRGGDVRGDDRRRRHAALHHRPGRGLARLAQHGAGQGGRSPSTCAIPTTRCWSTHEATIERSWRRRRRPARPASSG